MAAKKIDAFTQGVAWAIGTMYTQHRNGVECADLARTYGLTLAEYKAAGVDVYDMGKLRELFKAEPSAQKRESFVDGAVTSPTNTGQRVDLYSAPITKGNDNGN